MRRIPELDALRGLAAVSIVAYHLWFLKFGFLGTAVDLFFVMSGYLITTIILEQIERPGFLSTFYARRALRILPIYYLSLMAIVAVKLATSGPAGLDAFPYFLTYTQFLPNYWFAENPPFPSSFNHTWSLAVEEQYYLIWPPLLLLLGRRRLIPVAGTLIVLAVGARMAGFSPWILLTRCDGLALGGILAVLMSAHESGRISARVTGRALVAVGLASVAYLAVGGRMIRGLEWAWPGDGGARVGQSLRMLAINLMYLVAIGLVVLHSGRRWLAPLRDRRLTGLGQLSYGIYLYHCLVFEAVDGLSARLGISGQPAIDAMKLAASFGLAAASWRLVERPLLALKGRFAYAGGARKAPSPDAEGPILDHLGAAAT
jgi:peptidoglycan/LPS O-acetylase OafA/YrhL